jgi:hypothetical protein
MMKRTFIVFMLLFFQFTTLNIIAQSSKELDNADRILTPKTFKRMNALRVIVGLDENVSTGLSKRQFQTNLELKLRQNGILVKQSDSSPSVPSLILNFDLMPVKEINSCVYSVSLTLIELAKLQRNDETTLVSPWRKSVTGIASMRELQTEIGKYADNLTNVFLNNYFSENPR